MPRLARSQRLNVWMNGELVGHWDVAANGRQEFSYAQPWLDAPMARPLSLSLPLQPANLAFTGPRVTAFFDNLLPDNAEIRRRIQMRFGTSTSEAFDLLAEIGRDCVGAVQLLPADIEPKNIRRIEGERLTDREIAQLLQRTVAAPTLGQAEDDLFRISLAGMQKKTALLRHNGRWYRPLRATPSTHIFKLPLGRVTNVNVDLSASVENEWLCAQIIRGYGLPIANCEMATFGDQRVLIVERFDRRLASNGKWWLRLPQEDMCQATATPPTRKYQADGGPGARDVMTLLLGARDPLPDRRQFFKALILFWALAATDGHAKNFSLAIGAAGEYALTPLYDVISAYPVMGRGKNKIAPEKLRMSMAVHGRTRHYLWSKMLRRHWIDTARACNFGEFIEPLLAEIVQQTPAAIEQVSRRLPDDFPASVATPILRGLDKAVRQL